MKIKIESCPDSDLIGEHTLYFENLKFGSHQRNDFIIKASGVPERAISISCQPQGVFVRSEEIDHFLSNGKKVKGEKVHKPGDKVEFMGTVIEIKEYDNKSINRSVNSSNMIQNLNQLEGAAAEVAADIKRLLEKKK